MMKKKAVILPLAAAMTVAFCSCGNSGSPIDPDAVFVNNTFDYSLTEVCAFLASDDLVYAAFRDSPDIKVLDSSANVVKTLDLGEGYHSNLCKYQDTLYAFTYGETSVGITAYDLSADTYTYSPLNYEVKSALSMSAAENSLYLIYWSDELDENQKTVRYDPNDGYIYMGEKAVSVDLDTMECSDVDIKNVICSKDCGENEIMYYAYDSIGGYYFTIYDTVTKKFGEKVYNNNLGYTFSFAYNSDDDSIIYSDGNSSKLTSLSLRPTDVRIDFLPNVFAASGNDIQMSGGDCYVLDSPSGTILRTDYSGAVRKDEEIAFYASGAYSSQIPYGCGYKINTTQLSDEEFAMNILAGNSDYDICMMSSGQDFSRNIRDKGAFYPLNDLPMVNEYLDACFPYLKEAATDENGAIWMIPVAVDIPCVVYQEDNCASRGITFDGGVSWENLFEKIEELYEDEAARDKYQFNGYMAARCIIDQYNRFYALDDNGVSYDTSLFRELCELLKKTDILSPSLHTWLSSPSYMELERFYEEDFILTLVYDYLTPVYDRTGYDRLRAAELPDIDGETPSCADCYYFCVNENSENLSAALNYINTYCSYMLGRTDCLVFQDISKYMYADTPLGQDLHRIFSNAQVSFQLSSEIFWDDFQNYLDEKITLDEFITEVERKVRMFINE